MTGGEKKNKTYNWFTETFLCSWFLLCFGTEVETTERCSGSVLEQLTATTAGQEKYSYNFQYYVCPRFAFDSEGTVKGTKVAVTAEDLVIIGAYVRPASDFQNLASFVSLWCAEQLLTASFLFLSLRKERALSLPPPFPSLPSGPVIYRMANRRTVLSTQPHSRCLPWYNLYKRQIEFIAMCLAQQPEPWGWLWL